jgi:hypothetical protein
MLKEADGARRFRKESAREKTGKERRWPMKSLLVLLALFAAMSVVACTSLTSPTETRTNTFSVGSSPAVKVEVGSGNVDLVVGTAGEIVATAELRKPESAEYEVSQEGDLITVYAKTRRGSRADVTLTVPENTRFDLSTGSGNVDVAGVQALGRVNTGSGSITLEKVRGDAEARTGSGDVTLDGVEGSFNLNTGSGDITLRGAAGSFALNTGSGKITLGDATGSFALSTGSGDITLREAEGSFNLSTGSGDIAFQGELTQGSDNNFKTGSGSVTVALTGSPSVELDLEIERDGKVRSDLPVTVRESSERRLVGTIGNGEAKLTVRTGYGNITIK